MTGSNPQIDLLGGLLGETPPQTAQPADAAPQCSRRGCTDDAQWKVLWNNPRIHTPERRKVWLACENHREWLCEYLESRGLLKSCEPLTEMA
ncbi:MAG: hypothetical protein ACTHZ5_05770 [Micrococcaceae bacterium]